MIAVKSGDPAPRYHVKKISLADEYYAFVESRRQSVCGKGAQLHHVVPRRLGGKNDVVPLTPSEHEFAHHLLNLSLIQVGRSGSAREIAYTGKLDVDAMPVKKLLARTRFVCDDGKTATYMTIREAYAFCMDAYPRVTFPAFGMFATRLMINAVQGGMYFGRSWSLRVI